MPGVGKTLMVLGSVLVVLGLVMMFAPKIPYLGKLPGDIHIKKENFELYVPLTTSIVFSIVLSGIMWLIGHFGKK